MNRKYKIKLKLKAEEEIVYNQTKITSTFFSYNLDTLSVYLYFITNVLTVYNKVNS
jgi:hypothetical protein